VGTPCRLADTRLACGAQCKCPPTGTANVYTDFEDIIAFAIHILFHFNNIVDDRVAYGSGRRFSAIMGFLDADVGTPAGQYQLAEAIYAGTFYHRKVECPRVPRS